MSKPYLTPTDVAQLLMVSPITVRQWAARGALKAELTPGGHRRFLPQEVERFARERGVDLTRSEAPLAVRVLVVDDDPQALRFVTELLSTYPEIETATAQDGFNAGKMVHSFKPDVLLLDLFMPALDGFAVCRQLKQEPATRGLRVLTMTGYPSPENLRRSLDAGAEACLGKPLDTHRLRELLTGAASNRAVA